jgi:hypothetical protein
MQDRAAPYADCRNQANALSRLRSFELDGVNTQRFFVGPVDPTNVCQLLLRRSPGVDDSRVFTSEQGRKALVSPYCGDPHFTGRIAIAAEVLARGRSCVPIRDRQLRFGSSLAVA